VKKKTPNGGKNTHFRVGERPSRGDNPQQERKKLFTKPGQAGEPFREGEWSQTRKPSRLGEKRKKARSRIRREGRGQSLLHPNKKGGENLLTGRKTVLLDRRKITQLPKKIINNLAIHEKRTAAFSSDNVKGLK